MQRYGGSLALPHWEEFPGAGRSVLRDGSDFLYKGAGTRVNTVGKALTLQVADMDMILGTQSTDKRDP